MQINQQLKQFIFCVIYVLFDEFPTNQAAESEVFYYSTCENGLTFAKK